MNEKHNYQSFIGNIVFQDMKTDLEKQKTKCTIDLSNKKDVYFATAKYVITPETRILNQKLNIHKINKADGIKNIIKDQNHDTLTKKN